VNRNSATNEEQLVDVRGPGDFENGHIPQSINVPYQEFFDKETGGLKNKEKLKTCIN
jgi:rhodanese-related sulfurtransferase